MVYGFKKIIMKLKIEVNMLKPKHDTSIFLILSENAKIVIFSVKGAMMMFEKTIKYMEKLVEEQSIVGISYVFITPEYTIKNQIGLKQLIPKKEKIEESMLYDMASLTKVICTNTVLLKLIEEEKININQTLHYYLPEFRDKKVTIRQLLTHTSGINPFIPDRNELNQDQLRDAILNLSSGDTRGKVVKYTDIGTILLGFLMERLYDKSLHEVFTEHVLLPLEMKDSFFSNFDKKRAAPTELTLSRGLIQGEVHDPKASVLKEHCGSAGLFSTLEDTMKFTEMMLKRGNVNSHMYLQKRTINSLALDYTDGNKRKRSLGWDLIETDTNNLLFHTGYTGTFIIIDLEKNEAFIFLSNRVHPVDNRERYLELRNELVDIYLKETKKR